MQKESEETWVAGREKNSRKISHLLKKFKGSPNKTDDEWRGVAISDSKLDEVFKAPEMVIPNPDKIPLSDPEKQVLSLPPKFTKYEDTRILDIAIAMSFFSC